MTNTGRTSWLKQSPSFKTTRCWGILVREHSTLLQPLVHLAKSSGLPKHEANDHYLPLNHHVSLFVKKARKCLYRVCEDLTQSETARFISLVNNDMLVKGFVLSTFASQNLEAYLLYLLSVKYIKGNDFTNIAATFKSMEMEKISDMLKEISTSLSPERSVAPSIQTPVPHRPVATFTQAPAERPVAAFTQDRSRNARIDFSYTIGRSPGLCLIINQQWFYTEFDENLQVCTTYSISSCALIRPCNIVLNTTRKFNL